jgi:hypothetical protein
MASSKLINIEPKLDNSNFHGWKQKMVLILKSRRLWNIASGVELRPGAVDKVPEWEEKD